jgi:hypothetical protein
VFYFLGVTSFFYWTGAVGTITGISFATDFFSSIYGLEEDSCFYGCTGTSIIVELSAFYFLPSAV